VKNLTGHLDLTCSADEHQRSYLSHQSFRAPVHISKPYWDGHSLIVQVVNPTAGLFAGDQLRSNVSITSGARMLLTSPSSNRAHTMPKGNAQINQNFFVAREGWLEIMPELFIPQTDSRYKQTTKIEIELGGGLLFVETLAPGRIAHGECFKFTEIDWETNITYAGKLIIRERFILRRDDDSIVGLTSLFPQAYFASCYLITELIQNSDDCWIAIANLNSNDVWIASTRLQAGGWSIKLLARDSLSLRNAYHALRDILASKILHLRASSRKL